MKVLYIVTAYDRHPGDGITPWLVETIHRLGEAGVEVEVLAPSYRGLGSGRVGGVMVHRFRYAPAVLETLTHDQTTPDRVRERPAFLGLIPGYLLSASLAARRLARHGGFDLVHVHWPLPHAVPGWAARAAAGTPLVITFHGVELTFARHAPLPFLGRFLARAIRTADAVTANSTYTAGLIRALHDRSVEIVPFGSTLDTAAPANSHDGGAAGDREGPAPAGQRRLLFTGRLVERKGVHVLLEALQRLDRPEVHLDVVGEGPLRRDLEERARSLGVAARTTFHGFVARDELVRRLAGCDIFLLPAVHDAKGDVEGLGVVLIEALAHGRPVVASEAGGIPDIVRHQETGLLVPPGDVEGLTAAIRRLLDDPALAAELGSQGRAHVERAFSWDGIIGRLVELYQALP